MTQGVFIRKTVSLEEFKQLVAENPELVHFMTGTQPARFTPVMTEVQASQRLATDRQLGMLLGEMRVEKSLSAEKAMEEMVGRGDPSRQGMTTCFVRPRTKKILKETVRDHPESVFIEETSHWENEYEGPLTDAPRDAYLSLVGPEPSRKRSWFAGVRWNEKKEAWVAQ